MLKIKKDGALYLAVDSSGKVMFKSMKRGNVKHWIDVFEGRATDYDEYTNN